MSLVDLVTGTKAKHFLVDDFFWENAKAFFVAVNVARLYSPFNGFVLYKSIRQNRSTVMVINFMFGIFGSFVSIETLKKFRRIKV